MKNVYLGIVFIIVLIANTIWTVCYAAWFLIKRSYRTAYNWINWREIREEDKDYDTNWL